MFHKRAKNIIINRINRKPQDTGLTTDNHLLQLAEYYTRIFSDTLESRYMTERQKRKAMQAVNREYNVILSARRCMGMVS